jgi:hypothetical protein
MPHEVLDGRSVRHHFACAVAGFLQLERTMRILRRVTAATAGIIIAAITGCANPRTQANIITSLNDAANEITGLKNDMAQLQTQVDSLRTMVMQQDSLISRIAAVNNIPR